MERRFIALGGNVGAVEATFDRALARLDSTPGIRVGAVSRIHTTAPVGSDAGGVFRNAAAEVTCELAPLELLDVLQAVETECGRRRNVHWGPRTLDLDVILFGQRIIKEPRLRVPHPACWYRRFVLDPLVEVATDVIHPEKGVSIHDLRARLLVRPLSLRVAGGDRAGRLDLIATLQSRFSEDDAEIGEWKPDDEATAVRPTFVAWLGDAAQPDADRVEFAALPRIARLGVSRVDPATFLQDALRSALGE